MLNTKWSRDMYRYIRYCEVVDKGGVIVHYTVPPVPVVRNGLASVWIQWLKKMDASVRSYIVKC